MGEEKSKELAIVESDFKNLVRHMLSGKYQNHWMHTKLSISVKKDGLTFIFRSLEDDTVLKRMEVNNIEPGDIIKMNELIVSYEIDIGPKP